VLSSEFMVKTRVGIGGPQPAEVERMLGEARSTLGADQAWMQKSRQKIQDADARLDQAFGQLLGR
jgi:argininosuccinate lyase